MFCLPPYYGRYYSVTFQAFALLTCKLVRTSLKIRYSRIAFDSLGDNIMLSIHKCQLNILRSV